MQDWEVEVADESRIEEFSRAVNYFLNPVEKLVIMELVLSSIDDMLEESEKGEEEFFALWDKVSKTMSEEISQNEDAMKYWMDNFKIGEMIRSRSNANKAGK